MNRPKRFTGLSSRQTVVPGLALWLLLALTWWIYAPGLSGAFLFDDWANLPALGAYGPVDNWHTLINYLLSGIASPLGRPVSLLSFLIDANNWPAAAEPFKATNILVHLLNGALLYWLTLKLAQRLTPTVRQAAWVAVLSAGLWMADPLLVSTTLFVVQRMTELAATFVFAGLLCYLHGRRRLAESRTASAYTWMTAGIGLCGLLAVLSKENGVLLPLFVVIIEYFVLQQPGGDLAIPRPTPGFRIWRLLFLYLPIALVACYLLAQVPWQLYSHNTIRNFTLGERLLTETRILVRYLYLLVVPHSYTAGLYHDDIALSTSLWRPWTTLPSIALISTLLVLGWRTRIRYPALGLAIFFYFGGQLLESTVIPLELYFEHRNYLPAALLFFPLAMWIVTGKHPVSRGLRGGFGIALLAIWMGLTWNRAVLWGKPMQQAVVWARLNPNSPRAQTTLALHLMKLHHYRAAIDILQRAARTHPDNIMIQLNLLSAHCGSGRTHPDQLAGVAAALEQAKVGGRVAYNAIGKFVRHFVTDQCPGLGPRQLDGLIQAALDNPHVQASGGWKQDMLALRAELRLKENKVPEALVLFKQSLAAKAQPGAALYEAALLGSSGHPGAGIDLLEYFKTLPAWSPGGFNVSHLRALWLAHEDYFPKEIARVQKLLEQDRLDRINQRHPTETASQVRRIPGQ